MTNLDKQRANVKRGFVVVAVFLVGTVFGQWLNKPDPYEGQADFDTVLNKLDTLSMVCAKPTPKGQVEITSKDIIDAARGKQISFAVEVE